LTIGELIHHRLPVVEIRCVSDDAVKPEGELDEATSSILIDRQREREKQLSHLGYELHE
jgi:hypothetical protein